MAYNHAADSPLDLGQIGAVILLVLLATAAALEAVVAIMVLWLIGALLVGALILDQYMSVSLRRDQFVMILGVATATWVVLGWSIVIGSMIIAQAAVVAIVAVAIGRWLVDVAKHYGGRNTIS